MSDIKALKENLFYNRKNGRQTATEQTLKNADLYADGYKKFLDCAKTEREAVEVAIAMAKEKGFKPFEIGKKYKPGDKVYFNNRGKTVAGVGARLGRVRHCGSVVSGSQ